MWNNSRLYDFQSLKEIQYPNAYQLFLLFPVFRTAEFSEFVFLLLQVFRSLQHEARYSWFKINVELITSYNADDDSSAKPE